MQEFIIILIFALALSYLGYRAYRNFATSEAGCGKGCGCATDAKAILPNAGKKTTKVVG